MAIQKIPTLCMLVTACLSQLVEAKDVEVKITVQSEPISEVVVYLESDKIKSSASQAQIMDQVDKEFLPHVVAVKKGEKVAFPNSDPINHHVYSFSPAKTFSLKLFKDSPPQSNQVTFDKTGVVTVGCNIHDWMLGYIYVVDTPWFATTNADGKATISVPGDIQGTIKIWHPRFNQAQLSESRVLNSSNITIELQGELKDDFKTEAEYE